MKEMIAKRYCKTLAAACGLLCLGAFAAGGDRPSDACPALRERLLKPAALVKVEQSEGAFQGWRASRSGEPDSAFGRPLARGDEFLFDFGEHLVGYVKLELGDIDRPVDAPVRLDLSFAEVPSEIGEGREEAASRGTISPSWIQDETVTIDEVPSVFEVPRRFAFRYMRLRVRACSNGGRFSLRGVSARAVSSADLSAFRPIPGASPEDDAIDRVAAATLRDSMQTCLEDGPKRDRRLWLGDLRLQALANYATFRNYEVVRHSLFLLSECASADGAPATAVFERPTPRSSNGRRILDYTALFPATVLEYMRASGDTEAARRLWPTAKAACETVLSVVDETGLVRADNGFWNFIDWQDGFDRQASEQGAIVFGLDRAYELARALGREKEVAHLPGIAAKMRTRAVEALWDGSRGVWKSGRDGNVSWMSQAYMSICGAGTPEMRRGALERVTDMPDAVRPRTPYAYHYFVEGLWCAGMKSEALALVREYWGGMVKKGADTFWECYDPSDDMASPYRSILLNSYCHAWSCTPSYWLRRAREEGVEEGTSGK